MPLAIVFVKVALIGVTSSLTPLAIVLSNSKIDKKRVPLIFPSCRYKSQLIKRVPFFIFCKQMSSLVNATPFSTLQRNFHLQKSFHKPIFDILNRFDIHKKRSQNQSITVW